MRLSVVIPAYNEAKRIGATLDAICAYLDRQSYDWEVVVVNNNSKDNTADVVRGYVAAHPQIRILDEPRPGKGYAVTAGMLAAKGDLRVFTDADNSTDVSHVERMFPYIAQGYDVVIGSLAVPGAVVVRGGGEPLWRQILGKLGNKWIQAFAVWGISDTQRGFKMCTARAAQEIFSRMTIFGWGFDVEMLAIARTRKFRIKEVPVTWNNDPDSKVNFWAYPTVLLETLLVFLRRIRGVYRR